jgi:hypothetical protein
MTEQKLNEIDSKLSDLFKVNDIQYIYGGITQQPILRKWQQQAQLRQPPEFDFSWEQPSKDSVLTSVVLLDRDMTIDEYKDMIIYIDSYLVKRLYEMFGTKCVNRPGEMIVLSHMDYGDVFQFYVFYKLT